MSTLVWRLPHAGRWTIVSGSAAFVSRVSRAVRRRRAFKLMALGYLVKTLVFVAVWYAVPDLPQRIGARLQAAWAQLSR